MQNDKRIYWITTIIAMAMIVTPAFFYFTSAYLIKSMHNMGFPDYFRIELAIGKFIGAFLILIPTVPRMLKEWAYVGFGITLISGSIAHGLVDGLAKGIAPLIPLIFLVISYYYFHRKLQHV